MLKHKLLKWLIRIGYGVLLPCYLLFFALNGYYSNRQNSQKTSLLEEMNQQLDYLASYHSDEKFFHGILQASFARVDQSATAYKDMLALTTSFKNKFPGVFKFIIADQQGKIDRKNSDESRYFYIIRQLIEVTKKLCKIREAGQLMRPETQNFVAEKIALLRNYFGIFLMEKHLANPLKPGYLGSCIRASPEPEKSLLWFAPYRHFFIICFINKAAMNKSFGPNLICKNFNSKSSNIKLGYYNTQNFAISGLDLAEAHKNEIRIRAAEYGLSAATSISSKNFILVFRQVSPDLIVFAASSKSDNLISPQAEAKNTLLRLLKWLLIFAFVIYSASLCHKTLFLTIRQKLLLLFLFTNGLPLLIMLSTGYEYFEQKKQTMINSINNRSTRFLKEFDNSFPQYVSDLSLQINNYINQNPELNSGNCSDKALKRFTAFLQALQPDEAYLFNEKGEQILRISSNIITSAGFLKDFLGTALQIFNHSGFASLERKKTVIEEISDETFAYSGFLETIGKTSLQNFGSGNRYAYLNLLGNRKKYESWGFLLVAWKPYTLMKRFAAETVPEVNEAIAPRRLLVMEKESELIFPVEMAGEKNARRLMHRTKSRKLINETDLSANEQSYIANSIVGIELENAVLMLLHPQSAVTRPLDKLYFQIKLAFTGSLLFILVVFRTYTGKFSTPVLALEKGIKEIKAGNFKFRVNYEAQDEFGQLIQGFNSTIAGMEELASGTAVQESLLPEEKARFANLQLFGRSIFMNRMGGDYYDYFPLEGNKLGIFFGDVAGHGIPAAMIMAMSKAIVAANKDKQTNPANFLTIANSVFLYLKSKGWRRMMTALSLELNTISGALTYANAGQCFPVIVGENGDSLRYVKAFGLPLGNVLRRGYSETSEQLKPGETLILYTDGIIEATNTKGEVFAFERFESLLQDAWHADLEIYWEGIFAAYNAWVEAQDDDITFLMIRHEKNQ